LRVLRLSHNNLGVASGGALAKLLEQCQLEELYLDLCALNHGLFEADTAFAKALKGELITSCDGGAEPKPVLASLSSPCDWRLLFKGLGADILLMCPQPQMKP